MSRSKVESFVRQLLAEAQAHLVDDGGVLVAELDAAAMTALEGPWASPATLRLAFTEEDATGALPADLVAPGSLRLERFIAWTRHRGRLAAGLLPSTDPQEALTKLPTQLGPAQGFSRVTQVSLVTAREAWQPLLAILFDIARVGTDREASVALPAVNLVSGELISEARPLLQNATPLPAGTNGPPREARLRRHLSYRQALSLAEADVISNVVSEPPDWAFEPRRRYEAECRHLVGFYADLAREARGSQEVLAQIEASREARLAEQEDRFHPRVLVRPRAAALIWKPVQVFVLLLADDLTLRHVTVAYDPNAKVFCALK